MAKGENIFKRKDGRWEARYIKGRELSGKIRYGFCYGKTYGEVKKKVEKHKAAIIDGGPLPSARSGQRLAFYCDEWLRSAQKQVKESTYVKYETVIRLHIKPKLGDCFLSALTTEVFDDFSEELSSKKKLASKTVHDILVILHSILEYAVIVYEVIPPRVQIRYPKTVKKEMRVLSCEEQSRLASYLLSDMDACKFGLLLALVTGIRIGELCALRWGSISLDDRTVRITSTMQRLRDIRHCGGGKTKIVLGAAKSSSSIRTIPLPGCVVALCRQMSPNMADAYVLTGTTSWMELRKLQYRMKKYTLACGLDGVHCHTLRHTFATRAVEAGFDVKTLSEILGHSVPLHLSDMSIPPWSLNEAIWTD